MAFQLQDSLNLASKATVRRFSNAWRIYKSYQQSRITKQAKMLGMPISLAFEPTTSCNLRCPECPSGLRSFTRPTGMLDPGLFYRVVDEIGDTLSWLTFYFQGEPYLHNDFLPMVSYAGKKGIYTSTSTNAHYLDDERARATVESGLDRLIISIDGMTQDTYQSYRIGGKLDRVLEGTNNVIRWKKKLKSSTPHTIFQFLVVKQNEHQVEEVHQLARQVGVNQVNIKTAQIYDFENGSDLIPSNQKFSRYTLGTDGRYQIKNKLLNQCWKMWHSCVITWDGKVVPCCFDKDATHVMGDLSCQTFDEVWNSSDYRKFRTALISSRSEIEICRNCTEGTKVFAS